MEALAETFGDGAWLLILDNLEQVLEIASDLAELLVRCPGVAILATSRLGAGQFDQAFSAGSALTQREAVAIIRNQPDTGTRTS